MKQIQIFLIIAIISITVMLFFFLDEKNMYKTTLLEFIALFSFIFLIYDRFVNKKLGHLV